MPNNPILRYVLLMVSPKECSVGKSSVMYSCNVLWIETCNLRLWHMCKMREGKMREGKRREGDGGRATYIFNPRRACTARVTVLGLSVCVSITQHLTFHVIICATNDTNLLSGGWRSKILSDFLWKCFVAKLERFLLVWLHDKSAIFTPWKTRMHMNLDMWLAAILFLGETFFASSIIGHWQ